MSIKKIDINIIELEYNKQNLLKYINLQTKLNSNNENKNYEVNSIKVYKVKSLVDIPTVIKSKENENIKLKYQNTVNKSIVKVYF